MVYNPLFTNELLNKRSSFYFFMHIFEVGKMKLNCFIANKRRNIYFIKCELNFLTLLLVIHKMTCRGSGKYVIASL